VQIIREPNTPKEWKDYYQLRWQILRAPLQLDKGSEKDDLEDSAIHRAIIEDNNIVGVGRLHLIDNNNAQIRYMAVKEEFRSKGLGQLMVAEFIQISKKHKISRIILYARKTAIKFYEKYNFSIVKKAYRLRGIQHFLMEKVIND